MPRKLEMDREWLARAFRISALAIAVGIAPAGLLAAGWAHAIEAEGTADAGSGASASGTGEGTSSSGQESGTSATADTSSGGASASGEGSTTGGAQQSGDGGSIGAQTGANVGAEAETANGVSSAQADAEAFADTDPGKKTKLTASASATTSGVPTAEASTTKDDVTTTSATATYRQPGTYYCSDGCTEGYAKTTNKKSVSVAVQDDAYSLAVASRNSAYAKSGALSDFSKKEQKTINKTLSVGAYAFAGRRSAKAEAFAGAVAEIAVGGADSGRFGFTGQARSASTAKATACVGNSCRSKTAVATPRATVIKECDREERVIGFFKFPVCQYRVVAR